MGGAACRGAHVALDVAWGLAYLHKNKIAHLDIKSGNVLLTECVPPRVTVTLTLPLNLIFFMGGAPMGDMHACGASCCLAHPGCC